MAVLGIANATTYYVSPTGNDANNGSSQAQAWRTIARVQQHMVQFAPGDQVLFQRGGIYSGTLSIYRSGASGQPIVFGAYGSGEKPIISGGVPVTGWTLHQGNIWRAALAGEAKYLMVNNTPMTLARHPNTGWLRNVQGSNSTINAGGALNQANGHWNGATVVIRSTNWSYENSTVSSFSNGTLSFAPIIINLENNDWGFFLQNKLSALDQAGEWYHDTNTGHVYLWAPNNADPNTLGIQASVYDNGFAPGWQHQHMRIQDLTFQGQKTAGVSTEGASYVTVIGCTFRHLYKAISSSGGNNQYLNNTIENTYATAVSVYGEPNTVVEGNVLTDIAIRPGMGESWWGYMGLRISGVGSVVRNNRLNNIGYIGITAENNCLVERNVVRHATKILNDGAGIAIDHCDGLTIRDNIVVDMDCDLSSVATSHFAYYKIGFGIYFGNTSVKNTTVERNTVARCDGAGIHVDHTMVSQGNKIKDNVLFDNSVQLSISDYSNSAGTGAVPPYFVPQFDGQYTGNLLFSIRPEQYTMRHFYVYSPTPVNFGTFANNRHFSPYEDLSIYIYNVNAGKRDYYTLEQWQAARNTDVGSTRSPLYLSPYQVDAVLSPNSLNNGSFDSNVSGWSGWPNEATITRDNTFLDNGALKLDFLNNNTYDQHFLNNSAMSDLVTGAYYRLRMSIQSNVSGNLQAEIKGQSQMAGPYAMFTKIIPFDEQRRDLSIIFQSDRTEPARTQLVNHYTNRSYWIDNVSLERVQVTPLDPNERFVLLYNEWGTSEDFLLDGCWSDVDGNMYSGSITLAGFRSVVLQREDDQLCALTTGVEDAQAQETRVTVYPNPVKAGNYLTMTEAVKGPSVAELMDMTGRTVQRTLIAAGSSQFAIDGTVSAGSYSLVVRDQQDVRSYRLVVN